MFTKHYKELYYKQLQEDIAKDSSKTVSTKKKDLVYTTTISEGFIPEHEAELVALDSTTTTEY